MAISPTSYQQQRTPEDTATRRGDDTKPDPLKEQAEEHKRAQKAAILARIDQAVTGGGALGSTPSSGIAGVISMAGLGQQAVQDAISQLAALGDAMDPSTLQVLDSRAKKFETLYTTAMKIQDSQQNSIQRILA